jgi:hypothetical protein
MLAPAISKEDYLLLSKLGGSWARNRPRLKREPVGLRPVVMRSVRTVALVALLGCAVRVWPQQAEPTSSIAAANSALPDAPQAEGSAAQQIAADLRSGRIHGVVVDADGAVYQGVHIALTAQAQPVRSATSDSNGSFDFSDVPPGAFKLILSSTGFKTQVITGVLHDGESFETKAVVLPINPTTSIVRVTASTQEIALAQLHEEEKQRVLGIIPNFYVAYAPNAAPLTSKEKFNLAWKTSIDPVSFLAAGFFAGIEQANNTFAGYGQGAQGYAKRYGANYADSFIDTMVGGAILPSLLKQDPRYFYKGTGTIRSRVLYAIATSVICKGDNGHWQPNYSGIIGGLAAGGISNLYYPASDQNGASVTFENAGIGIAGGAVQNLLQEFLIRKLTHKVPDYGQAKP